MPTWVKGCKHALLFRNTCIHIHACNIKIVSCPLLPLELPAPPVSEKLGPSQVTLALCPPPVWPTALRTTPQDHTFSLTNSFYHWAIWTVNEHYYSVHTNPTPNTHPPIWAEHPLYSILTYSYCQYLQYTQFAMSSNMYSMSCEHFSLEQRKTEYRSTLKKNKTLFKDMLVKMLICTDLTGLFFVKR